MNWDALSAIGELLGATGVIVTLIYLSIQVRQNTRAIRGSTLNVLTGHHVDELRWSSEIGPAFRKAIHNPDTMSPDEMWQLQEWLTAAFVIRQNEFVQFQEGLLSAEDWKGREGVIRLTLGFDLARRWWRSVPKETFNSEFVARVDRLVEDGGIDMAEALEELTKPHD